ncbi:hypothetical protein LZG04_31835 [Saccharothrix sp. S26]|uniref:ABC transporter permease n=1 Tax=Saccharothrix sp. S26 TaxID=2907215 RepID=UPI001F30802B|nr:hypothetical protein [Saccharothrix sp. S26]MCE6999367.1 hypothetical protein [Saccharothrix sp. S26]
MTGTTTATAPVTKRDRVGWGDLAWLTWRRHRWGVLALTAAVGVVVALALGVAWRVEATGGAGELFGRWSYVSVAYVLVVAPMTIGLAIGVFWAAPLLSREYEQRTHVVAWSQDLTATRWLTGMVVLLGVPALVLSVGVGLALITLMNSVNAVMPDRAPFVPMEMPAFEATPLSQVAYASFGFALGLALSALTRRTVLSMGLTLGVFLAVRIVVSGLWRPYFQQPLRMVEPYQALGESSGGPPADAWVVNSGFSDAAGSEMPYPRQCTDIQDNRDYATCMVDHDVHYFSEYHPADRLVPFQLYEFAIYAVLAAALFALAFTWVRRARRV